MGYVELRAIPLSLRECVSVSIREMNSSWGKKG